jgi:hypothetical protein
MKGLALAIATTIVLGACSARTPGPGLPIDRVLAHVARIAAIGPRPDGSPEAAQVAAYLEAELAAAGAHVERHPVGAVQVPESRVGSRVIRRAGPASSEMDNLLVRFGPNASGALLFLAHYDSVPSAPGAVDNAAGVAVLLELARELAAHPPATPVWIALTAHEEVGLVGAHSLAARLGEHVAFAVALDLVGLDGPLVVNGASNRVRGDELRWLAAAADAAGIDLSVPAPHRIVSRWWPSIERSDHGAFTHAGVRAIHLVNRGGPTGERIYLAYHTPLDRPDQVSPPALAEVARLVRALAASPPPPPSTGDGGYWLPVPGNVVVPRWALVGACGVLVFLAGLGLYAQDRGGGPGPGLVAAALVWIAACSAALGAEHLAAGAHPAPWVHAPVRHLLALALVIAGAAALLATAIGRWRSWAGPDRYAVAGAGLNLAIAAPVIFVGAAELAWLWLVPAVALAWLPRLGGSRGGRAAAFVATGLAIAPTAAIVHPAFLRELTFHGFLPIGVPLTAWIAVHAITAALAVAHLVARARVWGPGASLAVPAAAIAALAAGALLLLTYDPPCAADAVRFTNLSCELGAAAR